MNQFDMKTVVISYILIDAVCAIVIASLWLRNRGRFAGLGLWAGGYIAYFVATLAMVPRVFASDLFSVVIGYSLFIGGSILLYMGLERFLGKHEPQIHNIVLLVIFIFADTYFVIINPNEGAHVVSAAVTILLIFAQSAWLIFRRADAEIRSISNGVGIVCIVSCLINLTRILVFLTVSPDNDFFHSNAYETSQLIISQSIVIALAFSLIMMVNRRLVASLERDIGKQKQAEEILYKSEKRYRSLFENMLEGFAYCKMIYEAEEPQDFIYLDVNTAFEKLTGLNNVRGKKVTEVIPGIRESNPELFDIYSKVATTGRSEQFEIYLDGLKSWFLVSVYSTEPDYFVAVFENITERKRMEEAQQYRNNVSAALQQVMLDLVDRHNVDDILQTLLIKIGTLLDAPYASIDLLENNDTLVTYAATAGQPLQAGDRMKQGQGGWLSWQAVGTGEPAVLEDYSAWEKQRRIYDEFPIHAVLLIPIKNNERVIGVINFLRSEANKPFNDTDIYAAKQLAQMVALVLDNAQMYSQLQSQLAESVKREQTLHEAQAQVIEQQRMMATIDERQRMARDLHDSVNQSIHSLMLFSETLVSMLDRNNVERARQISERLQESARQALKETRLLLYQTQASAGERGVNLIEELNARLANVELRAGVRAQIIQEGSLEYCPEAWYENLFWITIEALNNSLKHAQARSVQINIRCFPSHVELEVLDDGRGFDTTKLTAGGYGLRNMQERADLLGGGLTFTSIPVKGTSVLFRAEIKE